MGLIKAGMGALRGTLADQWKEFFYCDAMDNHVLVTKGKKRINSRSSNKKGSYLKICPLFLNTKRLGYFGERTAYAKIISWHLLVYQKSLQRF